MKPSERRILPLLLFPALGLLTGSALPELLRMGNGSYAGLSSLYSFRVYESISVDLPDLFLYVAQTRLWTLLFLWMSSFTSLGLLFHLCYAWWVAASFAMLLSLFVLRSGMQGILLFFCCVFPQWLVYAILWKREAASWIRRERGGQEITGVTVKRIRKKDAAELLGLAALCLFGCACEAFLGTWTLKLYLRL